MATSKKVTELDALTTSAAGDLLYVVDDPTGTPVSKKITVKSLLESNVTANANINGTVSANVVTILLANTPASNTDGPSGLANGSIWSDGDYIYVITNSGTNEVKKVALTSIDA